VDKHVVICVLAIDSVKESVVAALVSFYLDVDKQGEIFWTKGLSCCFYDLLDRLHFAHDACDHEGSQLFNAHFARLQVSYQKTFVQNDSVFAAQSFTDIKA